MIRLCTRLLLVASAATGVAFWPLAPVSADGLHHVYRTDGQGVWLHTVPAIQDGLIDVLPEGAEFRVHCWTLGDDVLGNPVWLYGSSELGTGYVTDYYIDTAWNTTADLEAQGMPNCGANTTPTEPQSSAGDSGWMPDCGASEYVDLITVSHWPDGNFKIHLTPSSAARFAWDPYNVTIGQWHAIQACVPGLYGAQADSIWDQLMCHQYLALVPGSGAGYAGGPTYGLESWRGTFSSDHFTWARTRCGNALGTGPVGDPL